MITTCGTNSMTSTPPPLRNKGRVNHTIGMNCISNVSSSIVSECAKLSSKNSCGEKTRARHINEHMSIKTVDNDATTTTSNSIDGPIKITSKQQLGALMIENQVRSSPPAPVLSPHSASSPNFINNEHVKDTIEPVQAVTPQDHNRTMDTLLLNPTDTDLSANTGISTMGMDSSIEVPNLYRISRGKVEQRYDMNLVPKVKRNPVFLRKWRQATLANASPPVFSSLPNLVPCEVSYCDASTDSKSTSSENSPRPSASQDQDHTSTSAKPYHQSCLSESNQTSTSQENNMAYVPTIITPFAEDCESCVWVPKSRSDWEDCIDELVNVCTAAAWHRERHNHKKKKEFTPPISQIYVKDRLDIDDPLRGYQIRHKNGGWLQGFIMMTNFTTWTHYFKWDSLHDMNGIDSKMYPGLVDNGVLTKDLESQPRSGDPHGTGVVWPTLAEISIVGGLGCGEYLLQMALDDIERRGSYEFVVLEATDTSRPFYEKFGFVRVGAVCKYGKQEDFAENAKNVEVTGYRHWTYANESKARLNEHGGPSWMMARRIKKRDAISSNFQSCGKDSLSFIDQLATYFVSKKPKIEPLGTSGNRKRSRAASTGSMPFTSSGQPAKIAKIAKDPSKTTLSGRQSKTSNRLEETSESLLTYRPKSQNAARSSRNSASAALLPKAPPVARGSNKPILRKQKIANMYRDPKKVYYYNKVVTPSQSNQNSTSLKSKYYFVLNFDATMKSIRLIPLYRRGTFKGKREGREKWKATILQRNDADESIWLESMNVITAPASQWSIVSSYMVTKCSSVGEESWDILA